MGQRANLNVIPKYKGRNLYSPPLKLKPTLSSHDPQISPAAASSTAPSVFLPTTPSPPPSSPTHCVQLVSPFLMAEPCSCKAILENPPIKNAIKAAVLKVYPSIVNVITHNLPHDMIVYGGQPIKFLGEGIYAYPGSGIIIQSENAGDGTYCTTIIAPANLFKRTNDLPPDQIPIDVRVSGDKLFKGELLACDFHYNLAAVKIQSASPLKPATIRHLNGAMFTDDDSDQHLQSHRKRRKHLSNFNSFNVKIGTEIMTAERACDGQYKIVISTGVFSGRDRSEMPRKELFSIKGSQDKFRGGGAVLNYNGEVIGICFSNASFLPFNLVQRWWDHFKRCREYQRPYLGVEVANRFIKKTPNTVTGVVVTKVEENSAANRLGIKRGDVIIKCDGVSLCSKLELFERTWDNAGQVVELSVVKASDGVESVINMPIEETPKDKLYEWNNPRWWVYWTANECTSRANESLSPLRECTSKAHQTTLKEMMS